jgi:6-pyruvoyltetrahydropterin/6-carboxytetrahydropterin synthase
VGKYELLLRTTFAALHQLKMPDGSVEPLHRHDWRVEAYLQGEELGAAGLLADFTVLHQHLAAIIADLRDRPLNELPAFSGRNPATEAVAKYLHDRLAPIVPANVRVTKVRVWETDDCAAAYIPDTASAGRIESDAHGIG